MLWVVLGVYGRLWVGVLDRMGPGRVVQFMLSCSTSCRSAFLVSSIKSMFVFCCCS